MSSSDEQDAKQAVTASHAQIGKRWESISSSYRRAAGTANFTAAPAQVVPLPPYDWISRAVTSASCDSGCSVSNSAKGRASRPGS